jgi:ribonuclease P protein component
MTLSVLPQGPDASDPAAVAFLTPKRLGRATVRNKVRRRMREIHRRHLRHPSGEFYLVWIARPPAIELPFEQLKEKMSELAARIG